MRKASDKREERRRFREMVLSLPCDTYGDTVHDRALRMGLKPDTHNAYFGCSWCADLPHRRHEDGCPGCSKPYQPERIEHALPELQSSAGMLLGEP